MNQNEIATKGDIEMLLKEIQKMEGLLSGINKEQKYLRSADVRKMLNISDGTLQRLRITGTLNAKKINGTWFYMQEDIQNLMNEKK